MDRVEMSMHDKAQEAAKGGAQATSTTQLASAHGLNASGASPTAGSMSTDPRRECRS